MRWERRRAPTQAPSTDMAAQSRSQGKLLERLLAFLKVGVVTELQTLQELFPGIATATLGAALQRFRGGASKSQIPNPQIPNPKSQIPKIPNPQTPASLSPQPSNPRVFVCAPCILDAARENIPIAAVCARVGQPVGMGLGGKTGPASPPPNARCCPRRRGAHGHAALRILLVRD